MAPIGVLSAAHDDADLAVARAAVEQEVTPILSTQASVPMEEVAAALGGAGHWYQLYWSRDDDLVASLVQRAEACGSEAIVVTLDTAYLGWRPRDLDLGHLPFARGEGIAQYTSDPVFRRLVEERVAAAAQAEPEPQPRPTPAAVRTLVSLSRNHPGDTRRNLSAPEPRAAVETFLDVFSKPVAQLGRPAPPARADHPARRAQGGAAPRRRAPRGRRRGSTASSCRTTAGGRSTARWRPSTRCPASSTPCAARARTCRCSSTAASVRAPTCSWRSPWARMPSASAARTSTGSRWPAPRG